MKKYFKKFCLIFIIFLFLICISFKNNPANTKEIHSLSKVKENILNTRNDITFFRPLEGSITSAFGYRIHPITNNLDFHPAIDIGAPMGSLIHSIFSGKIKETGYSKIYGNYIIISHSNNLESKYCHCEQIFSKKKSSIKKGQVIATVGHSGLATGDHLHLEIKIKNIFIDPALLIMFDN